MTTVAIIAPGFTLTRETAELCAEHFDVLAVTIAFRFCPRVDHLYACDGRWWDRYAEEVKRTHPNAGLYTHHAIAAQTWGLIRYSSSREPGLSRKPRHVHQGRNSGFQALNLALHLGYSRALLVGYDMRASDAGRQHARGLEYPKALDVRSNYGQWATEFDSVQDFDDFEILNCTPGSAIRRFPFADLDEVIHEHQSHA